MPRDANGLTPKQALFVAEYLKDLNATQAAIRAGYSAKTADRTGPELLGKTCIADAVAAKTQKQLERADVKAEDVLREISRLAMFDPRKLFDEDGKVIPIKKLSDEVAACLVPTDTLAGPLVANLTTGDGRQDLVYRFKTWDKNKALENLAKYFGLLTERVEISGSVDIVDKLNAGRKRLAGAHD